MAYQGKRLAKKKRKKWKTVLLVTLLVIILLMTTLVLVVNGYLNKINRVGTQETIPPEEEDFITDAKPSDAVELDPEDALTDTPDELLGDDHLLNIMLIGQDRREGEGRARSDTMILCSMNTETGEMSLVSFMRDLYVSIPGYSDNRMNAAYAFGGMELLDAVMEENFGITIDGNIEVDFNGFVEVIDILGGVDIELTSGEAREVGGGATAGMNHLDGEQALAYARIRVLDDDFHRTERQRKVLESVLEGIRSANLGTLLSILDAALPCVTTDMSNVELISLVTQAAPVISGLDLESYRIPADDAYQSAYVNGMAVLVPDLEKNRQYLLEEYLPMD